MSLIIRTVQTSKEICNAVDCHAEATQQIVIDCGTFGKKSLWVCDNCSSKFVEEKRD